MTTNTTTQTDEGQPYEQEFFDFLKKYGGLDWYIENRLTHLEGAEFKLTTRPKYYISRAFKWPLEQWKYWRDMCRLWKMELEEMEAGNA